jgi:VanZ family protein
LVRKIFRIFCVIQLFVATFLCIYFSAQTNVDLPKVTNFDKLVHFGAFFIYGLSLQVAFFAVFQNSNKSNNSNKKFAALVIIFGFLFALSDEIHQYFVPNRNADILDLVVDFIGITFSLIFLKLIRKIVNAFC